MPHVLRDADGQPGEEDPRLLQLLTASGRGAMKTKRRTQLCTLAVKVTDRFCLGVYVY